MLDHIQNLGYAFLARALMNSGDWIEHMLQSELSPLRGLPHYQDVVQLVRATLAQQELLKAGKDQSCVSSLQTTLQGLVGLDIATPIGHEGEWDQNAIKRIWADVETQFERSDFQRSSWLEADTFGRPLSDCSEGARLGLAQSLKKLPCMVNCCDGTDCKAHCSSSINFPFALTCYSAGNRLLDGPAEEVTPAVRREVFRALRRAIDHHAINVAPDGLEQIAELLMQHIKDPDRNTRLSAW
jgi:serine/threonine-protein kinase ATR